ncbi:hypothetical protein QQX98_008562 [Neonectria punicea]|uniref:3-beta hydroxysteroid dehydrogenase/isomerase domain-containing protein n=1 Tax=Neonectria punicea TaxID=979145 RepID=A0ABR1GUP3_9HYPO
MAQNILITGAAGFIGGSLLADLLFRNDGPIKTAKLFAAVRSQEQVQSLSKLGVGVVEVDLLDKQSVEDAIIGNKIDLVLHTAGAVDSRMASNIIDALGQRRRVNGTKTYYIHSSVMTMFSEEGGWPYGEVKDTDAILEKEKEIQQPNPVRHINILVAEQGKAQDVVTFNVAVPMVYGRGTGEWRKLSVNIPASVRTSIKLKTVHKFDKDASPPAVHISDLTELYVLLLENVLQDKPITSCENGYYFAMAHRSPWGKVMTGLAKGLHSRELVETPEVHVWPSHEEGADSLGFPRLYIRGIAMSSGDMVPVNAYKLGWKPKWDEERFLGSIDDEIQAVQELDTVKMSLFDSLIASTDK